jgi:hypothetical protein
VAGRLGAAGLALSEKEDNEYSMTCGSTMGGNLTKTMQRYWPPGFVHHTKHKYLHNIVHPSIPSVATNHQIDSACMVAKRNQTQALASSAPASLQPGPPLRPGWSSSG